MNNKSELPDFVMYQLLENVMDMIHDGVLVVNIKFDIMYINAYANNLLINKNNITNLLLLFPQLNFLHDANEKFFKNRKIEINISENKTEKHLEFIFNTVSKENQYFHLIIINNIMQKKDEHKTSGKCLMAYLSHELRNPLQSITLASHLVKTGIKSFEEKTDLKIPPKLITHINTVNKSCHDMKIIINDILDLSRIEANELVIEMEICYINDIIDSVIDDNIHESSQKGLNFIKIIEKNVPKTIFTDMTRINQILCNLVSNSIKYSEKGNITLKVSYDKLKNNVIFDIIDEGIGIKDNDIQNLFKTYGKTSNNYKVKACSEGLGLCISQKLANLLGGQITVKSEMNIGSIFSLMHPIKLGMSGVKFEENESIISLSGNVLLVDDNNSNLSLLHMLLDQFNYEYMWTIKIESVSNGNDAIELCKINKYDLIRINKYITFKN